jgi:hypothetical protein
MMETHQLNIDGRQNLDGLVKLNDFDYTDGGIVDTNVVVENPQSAFFVLTTSINKRSLLNCRTVST